MRRQSGLFSQFFSFYPHENFALNTYSYLCNFLQQVSTTFTRDSQDFKLVKYSDKVYPLNILVDTTSREIVFEEFVPTSQDVYYWSLPAKYLGDKVTSYGGNLTYTVRHVPAPGGQSSKNNAVDVEIVGVCTHKLCLSRWDIEFIKIFNVLLFLIYALHVK